MSVDTIRAFFGALARSEWAAIEDRLHDDVVFEFPGRRFGARHVGRRRVMVFLRQNQRLFDGPLEFTIHWVGTSGDRAVAQWTNAGRTKTGVDYANRGVTVFRVDADGRIVEIQDYLDTERLSETWPRT